MTVSTINLQPDPRILIAITHNPMRPIDALSELIDNSIDSFLAAEQSGVEIESPTIMISLPRPADVERGGGAVSILDNGPGLSLDETRDALRAGFTSNNPFDRLGLFGMGFNISTGKLGRRTVFRTARPDTPQTAQVTIDLEAMVRSRTYDVPVEELEKQPPNFHGTQVQVSDWWSVGNQNHGFAAKLIRLGQGNIVNELGRRYYPILRGGRIRIFVNDEPCEPFEHCVWADHRAINHRELGVIAAVIRLDTVVHTQLRCTSCYCEVEGDQCLQCGPGHGLRTVEERIRGWVGIQRFDDANNFGIDLIRNGRVIRKWEKDAFFTWTDSRGREVKDYPIDSPYGRIVGEVHLNHVPTDFMKQDFQRTSPEWMRAVARLRGESSLQPRIAAEAGEPRNESPVYQLFQGYRRVRDTGTRDLYMGYWEPGEERARRISREAEKEYYSRFLRKEPGFYDDTEWWKLVEQADTRPVDDIQECPECAFQTLVTAETCLGCGYIFRGKNCINAECGAAMPLSAVTCPQCDSSQEVRAQDRWTCAFCSRQNPPAAGVCVGCGRQAGEMNPLSLDFLVSHSNKNDDLSLPAFAIPLPEQATSGTFDVDVYTLEPGVTLERDGVALPTVTVRDGGLKIFIDARHPLFAEYQQRAETAVAMEIAKFIQDANARHMAGDRVHAMSLPTLCWRIARTFWKERLSVDPERTRRRAEEFFERLRDALPELLQEKAPEIYSAMTPAQQGQVIQSVIQNGYDARELPVFVESGKVLLFLDHRMAAGLVERYPAAFFDGKFWDDPFESIPIGDQETLDEVKGVVLSRYRNFLEDILGFLEFRQRDIGYTVRAERTLHLLTRRMV